LLVARRIPAWADALHETLRLPRGLLAPTTTGCISFSLLLVWAGSVMKASWAASWTGRTSTEAALLSPEAGLWVYAYAGPERSHI